MEKSTLLQTETDKIYFQGHRLSDIMKTVPPWAIHRIQDFLDKESIFLPVKNSESFLPQLNEKKELVPAKNDLNGFITVYDCFGKSKSVSKHLNFILNVYNDAGFDIVFATDSFDKNVEIANSDKLDRNKNYCIVNLESDDVLIYTGPPSIIGRGLAGDHIDRPFVSFSPEDLKANKIRYKGLVHHYPNENKEFYIDFLQSNFGNESLSIDDGKNEEKINSLVDDSLKRVQNKFCYRWNQSDTNIFQHPFHISYNKKENQLIVYCGDGEKEERIIPLPEFKNEKQYLEDIKLIEDKLESIFGVWLFKKDEKDTIPLNLRTSLNQVLPKNYAEQMQPKLFSVTFYDDRSALRISDFHSHHAIFFHDKKFKEMFLEYTRDAVKKKSAALSEIDKLNIFSEEAYMFGYKFKDEFQFTSPFGDVLAPVDNKVGTDWVFLDFEGYKNKLRDIRNKVQCALKNCEFDVEIECPVPFFFIGMCDDLGIEKRFKSSSDMEDIFSKFIFDATNNTVTFYSPEACEKLFECTAEELYNEEILAEKMDKFLELYKEQYDQKTGIAKCFWNLIPSQFKDNVITNIIEWDEKYVDDASKPWIFLSNEGMSFNACIWDASDDFFDIDFSENDFSSIEETVAGAFSVLAQTFSSNLMPQKIIETISSDAAIAAKRIASQKVVSLIKNLMITVLHKTKKLSKADAEKFFNSAYGKAAIGVVASFMLKSLNSKFESKYSPIIEEISDELRISSETEIVSEFVEKLTEVASSTFSTGTNSMESLVRVVSAATETAAFNQEELNDYMVNNVEMCAAVNN